MRRTGEICLSLSLVLVGLAPAEADPRAKLVAPLPLETRMLDDARDGELSQFSLFQAALIASGIGEEEQVAQRWRSFQAASRELWRQCPAEPGRARVAAMFQQMHARFLKGDYSADCTEFQQALDEGRYNCVTATLLFHCLCLEGGLQPRIVAASSHVFSQFTESDLGDVETTCAEWFVRQPSGASGTSEDRANSRPREITPVQLLGRLYYNAGVARLEAGDYPAAVRALETSVLLDEADRAARHNLLAALNNWALVEADAARFAAASRLIERGLQLAPDDEPLRANDLHVHQNWALDLCRSGEYRQGLELLEQCHARRPDADLFDLGRLALFSLWAEALLKEGQLRAACQVLEEGRQRFSGRPEWIRYEEDSLCVSIDQLVGQGRQAEAVDLATLGLARQPDSQRLRQRHRDLTRPPS